MNRKKRVGLVLKKKRIRRIKEEVSNQKEKCKKEKKKEGRDDFFACKKIIL